MRKISEYYSVYYHARYIEIISTHTREKTFEMTERRETSESYDLNTIQFKGPKPGIDESVNTSLAPLASVIEERSITTPVISIDSIPKDQIQISRSVKVSRISIGNQNSKRYSKDVQEIKMNCCGLSYEFRSSASKRTPCCFFCCCTCFQ